MAIIELHWPNNTWESCLVVGFCGQSYSCRKGTFISLISSALTYFIWLFHLNWVRCEASSNPVLRGCNQSEWSAWSTSFIAMVQMVGWDQVRWDEIRWYEWYEHFSRPVIWPPRLPHCTVRGHCLIVIIRQGFLSPGKPRKLLEICQFGKLLEFYVRPGFLVAPLACCEARLK